MSYSNQIQYEDAYAIVTADEVAINADAIFVGSDGDLALATKFGTVLLTGVKSGTVIPIYTKNVVAAGTTATGLVALYCQRRPVSLQGA